MPEHRSTYSFVVADSLQTIVPDVAPKPMNRQIPLTGFAGETVAFQLAYLPPTTTTLGKVTTLGFVIGAEAAPYTKVSAVDLVPCTLLAYDLHDEGYLFDKPGLYPDVLRPLATGEVVRPIIGQWRAVWIALTVPDGLDGTLPVTVSVVAGDAGTVFTATVDVQVSSQRLPALDIVNTHWLHFDAIAADEPEGFRRVHLDVRENRLVVMRKLTHVCAVAVGREDFCRHGQARSFEGDR